MHTRRWALSAAVGLCSSALLPRGASATAVESRSLQFQHLHTGEHLEIEYWRRGSYAPDALRAINHLLRDFRNNETHTIDTRLLDTLSDLSGRLETGRPFQVISGYRSPQTNAALAEASSGVARHSLHMDGQAIDIAVEGVSTETLRAAALALGRGGVGYYPNPGFVHVDVGRIRQW